MKALFSSILLAFASIAVAQVAITNDGTIPDPSAMLDIKSTTRGLLAPRMTQTQRNAITSPSSGLIIYQTDNTPGYYYNTGTSGSPNWSKLLISGDQGIGLTLPYFGSANSTLAFFVSNQRDIAIEGQVTAASGAGTGVFGESYSSDGRGVAGNATCTTATAYGVYGSTLSPYGAGVAGIAANNTGYTNGVSGTAYSLNGAGVVGQNLSMTGTTYGVNGHVNSPTGFSGYFTGPKFYVSAKLGIGTTEPTAQLEINGQVKMTGGTPGAGKVLTSDADGLASWQTPTASLALPYEGSVSCNGAAFKIINVDYSNAIHGISSAVSGIGVIGESYNFGVIGKAIYTAGPNWGVSGESASSEGRGVYGKTTSSSGYNIGVLGETVSTEGIGVFGDSKSPSGNTFGVKGYAASLTGTGVFGFATNSSGDNVGISGESLSSTGAGVKGRASSTTGETKGVYGIAVSPLGTGVYGTGQFGVRGLSTNATGYGVYGYASGVTGSALFGRAEHATGANYGVVGISSSSSGTAILGSATSVSGSSIAVKGETTSSSGYSGYFTGGMFHVNGRVGIGTTTPGAGLHVHGSSFPNTFIFIEGPAGQDAGFRFYEGGSAKWHLFNNSGLGGLQLYNNAGVTGIFVKQSNSYVGIGTTAPTYQLQVVGDAAKNTGAAWTVASDIRLKNLQGNYNKGLEEIDALQPVRFTYKPDNLRNIPVGTEQAGFVAQEVQKIFPEAVTMGKDGYLDFNMHAVNVAMVNAIKELKAENELLKARLEKLEKQLNPKPNQ